MVEFVIETQAKGCRKGKVKVKTKNNQHILQWWTTDEEFALAEAWCETSKSNTQGNGMKKKKTFWEPT